MSEEPEPESRPRISITPFLEALEYDADYHLHRDQRVIQPEVTPTQEAEEASEQAQMPASGASLAQLHAGTGQTHGQGRRGNGAAAGGGRSAVDRRFLYSQ